MDPYLFHQGQHRFDIDAGGGEETFAQGESIEILLEVGAADLQDFADQRITVGMGAARIVRSLLDYTRDRGFRRRQVNLADLVDETLRFLKTRRGPGVTARIEIPADLKVAADRPRLQQALVNLIGNALEAMGEKGELSILARRGQARRAGLGGGDVFPPGTPVIDILIADTGPGIPAEVLPRIFDPFYTTKPVGQGSGLGLFIVHQVMEEHGGWIGAENLASGGARFHIRLPEGAAGATSTAYKSKP